MKGDVMDSKDIDALFAEAEHKALVARDKFIQAENQFRRLRRVYLPDIQHELNTLHVITKLIEVKMQMELAYAWHDD
jgi:hypothetical protein